MLNIFLNLVYQNYWNIVLILFINVFLYIFVIIKLKWIFRIVCLLLMNDWYGLKLILFRGVRIFLLSRFILRFFISMLLGMFINLIFDIGIEIGIGIVTGILIMSLSTCGSISIISIFTDLCFYLIHQQSLISFLYSYFIIVVNPYQTIISWFLPLS